MAYFRADLCIYSPESYSLDEKKEICNDMMSASKAVLADAMREDFEQLPPDARAKLLDMLCASGVESPQWWWMCSWATEARCTASSSRSASPNRHNKREKAVNRVGGLPLYSSSWCSSMISASFASCAFSSACIFRKWTPSPSTSIALASL